MNRIREKRELAPKIKLIEFENPNMASRARPGQFVIIQTGQKGERFPLTISGTDPQKGLVKLVFNEVGVSSQKLGELKIGEDIENIAGPLGNPTEIDNFGTVVCFGGGVMVGPMIFETAAFREAGNRVIAVIGARSQALLILQDEMRAVSHEMYCSTDDGSYGYTGLEFLKGILQNEKIDRVIAMSVATRTLKYVSELTRQLGIKTIVSLTPVMLDATGMCGACRVMVGGNPRFACVDGPEFDGHQIDWELLESRKRAYSPEERLSALARGEDLSAHCFGARR